MKIEPVICVIGCFSLSLLTCIQNTFQYLSSDSITGELRAFPVSKREGDSQPECVMGNEKGKSQYPALVMPVWSVVMISSPELHVGGRRGRTGQQDMSVQVSSLSLPPPSPAQDRPPLSSSHSHLLTSHILLYNLCLMHHMNTIQPGVLSTQPLPHARTERERERAVRFESVRQWKGREGDRRGQTALLCSPSRQDSQWGTVTPASAIVRPEHYIDICLSVKSAVCCRSAEGLQVSVCLPPSNTWITSAETEMRISV